MARFTLSDVVLEPGRPAARHSAATTRWKAPRRAGVGFSRPYPAERMSERILRRTLDVGVALSALLVLSPALLLVAAAIKLTSPGPVFYRQTRVGRNVRRGQRRSTAVSGPTDRRRVDRRSAAAHGRPFQILKFRTMVVNAEEYGPQWSTRNDPRITAVGRFLRKTRLDETPQFWNVLRGEMSVIGPRPERPYFVDQFVECIPGYSERLHVRPGITGLAQVTLEYDSSIDDVKLKLERDLTHVHDRSLAKDLSILARTGYVVVTGKGAL